VGLGLSIVRSFVELHGGRVELETEQGVGTCVTCHFPLQVPDEPQPERRPELSRVSIA
jgi:signal transduction histidine kinase